MGDVNDCEFDEMASDFNSLKLSALINAARSSSCNMKCTIGPKIVTNKSKIKDLSDNKATDLRITIPNRSKNDSEKSSQFINDSFGKIKRNVQVFSYNSLSDSVLLKNAEKQRKNDIGKEMASKQIHFKNEALKRQQLNQQNKEKAHQELYIRKLENDQRIVEQVERNTMKNEESTKKILEKIKYEQMCKIKNMACEVICKYQSKFKTTYERISKILQTTDRNVFTKAEEFNKKLIMLIEHFDELIKHIKNDDIGGMNEVKSAENLCSIIDQLERLLILEIEKFHTDAIAKEAEAIRQISENERINNQVIEQNIQNNITTTKETLNKPIEVNNRPPPPPPVESVEVVDAKQNVESNTFNGVVNSDCLAIYNSIMAFYHSKVESIKPLQADENMKKYRFSCQKAINIPVNAISAVTPQHLQDKCDKLLSLLSGAPIKTVDGSVISINDHPLGRDFCLLLLAKKFVGQGDSMISSNLQAAFPMAAVIVSIWQKIPEFGTLFLAYTFKECPYLVPYFIPQFSGQSIEDYYKVLGYRFVDGNLEKQVMYLKRQSGIVRLYSAVMTTEPRQIDGTQHPYGLDNGWRWLCNLLNLDPLPDICATLIFEFLQIAGYDMWRIYGVQFEKLLYLIQIQYFPKLAKVDEGGPKARLEVFVMDVIKNRQIEKPQGVIPSNFW